MRFPFRLVVVILLLGPGKAWAGAQCQFVETATKLYARAVELSAQGDFQGALTAFKDAYAASPCFKVKYNIAQVLIELDRPLEARETLLRYLWEGQDQLLPERILQVQGQVRQLEAFLGEVVVTTEPLGALVAIDGRVIGPTPLAEPTWLESGAYTFTASLDGFQFTERSVLVGKGKRYEVALQLPRSSRGRLRTALPYALLGTGVALAGAAVGAYLWERQEYEKWQAAQPALQGAQPKSPAYAAAATESNRLAASVATAEHTLLGFAIGSGVLLAAGASLYFIDRSAKTRNAKPTLAWSGGTSLTAGWSYSW